MPKEDGDKALVETERTELAKVKEEEVQEEKRELKEKKKKEKKKEEKRGWQCWVTVGFFGIAILLFGWSFFAFRSAVSKAADEGWSAFADGVSSKTVERREQMGQMGFDRGFEDYRTVNDVSINVDEVRKTAKLEVMKVSSVVYIHDTGKLGDKVLAWLKVRGEGVYTVDMAAGEYLVDEANRYVLVKVPAPELGEVDITEYENRKFESSHWFTVEKPGEGVALAMNQLAKAQRELTDDIKNNLGAREMMEPTARTLITALVRSLNPEVPDLTVEVEFF